MKRKIFRVLFALVLVLSFSLIPATPAFAAAEATMADVDMGLQNVTTGTQCKSSAKMAQF